MNFIISLAVYIIIITCITLFNEFVNGDDINFIKMLLGALLFNAVYNTADK